MPVTPADDQRHEPDSDAPSWSERWGFYFIDPRQQLCCLSRLGLMPNTGTCSVAVAMSRQGKPLYHRQLDGLPIPGGDVLSGLGSGGLSFRALSLPRGRFLVSFDDPASRFRFDLDWQGLHDATDSTGLHAETSVAGLYGLRVEQLGRIIGRMTLRDRTFDLVGFGPRVHSVGESGWETRAAYDAASVILDDGRAFGLSQIQHGSGQMQIPWMWDREKIVPLSRMRFDKRLTEDGRPVGVTIHATDPEGRSFLLHGTTRTSMPCYLDTYVTYTAYCDFVLDDGTKGVGSQEFGYRLGD